MPFPLQPQGLILLAAFVFGSVIGSFFNVVIHRMPRGESVLRPPSHCTGCGRRVRFHDNIPVLSWLLLKGRCRFCGSRIGWTYPAVELTAGFAAAALAAAFAWGLLPGKDFALSAAYLILVSIPILIIDIRHYLIPDLFTVPGMLLGLALSLLPGGLTPAASLIGLLGAGGFLWLVGFAAERALRKEAMGFGDVKLLAMAGALFGLKTALLGLVFASFLGCLAGLPLLLLRRLPDSHHLPFGPFICAGVVVSAFAGDAMLGWYFNSLWPAAP